MVGDRLDRRFEPRRLRGEAGDDGRHQHAGVDAGVAQLPHGAQPLQRVRGAGLERAPGVLVDRRHAHADRAPAASRPARRAGRRRARPSAPSSRGRPACAPRAALRAIGASACSGLRSADTDRWRCRRRPSSRVQDGLSSSRRRTSTRFTFTKISDENSSSGPELELRLVAAREAVVAAVRAAAIRVQRPVERHPLHRVQRRRQVIS